MLRLETLWIAAILLIAALELNSKSVSSSSAAKGRDYITGELTKDSVLAHNERVIASENATITWHGLFNITRVEILDQSNTTTGYVSWLEGGVNNFHIRIVFNAYYPYDGNLDFIINIYGEPLSSNYFVIGEQTLNSRLVHTERILTEIAYTSFSWSGPYNIVQIEALDQIKGDGSGVVYYVYDGLNKTSVSLHMKCNVNSSQIDFVINIYGENLPQNDFINGNLTENSVLLFTERVTGDNSSGLYRRNTTFIITRLEVFDQTNGFGKLAYANGGIKHRFVELYFTGFLGYEMDFIANIYGEPVTTNDIIEGEITETSNLVQTWSVTTDRYYFSGLQVISRIEILDQSNGNGGFVSHIFDGVSQRNITVFFEPINDTSSIDFIINVYTEPLKPNNYFVGELTSASVLRHRQRIITAGDYYTFSWSRPKYMITRIEARDQSIGDGGMVAHAYDVVNSTYVTIIFETVRAYSTIDFIIDIYAENVRE